MTCRDYFVVDNILTTETLLDKTETVYMSMEASDCQAYLELFILNKESFGWFKPGKKYRLSLKEVEE